MSQSKQLSSIQALHVPPLLLNFSQSERTAATALFTVTMLRESFLVITGAKAALIRLTVIKLIINSTSEKASILFSNFLIFKQILQTHISTSQNPLQFKAFLYFKFDFSIYFIYQNFLRKFHFVRYIFNFYVISLEFMQKIFKHFCVLHQYITVLLNNTSRYWCSQENILTYLFTLKSFLYMILGGKRYEQIKQRKIKFSQK